MKTVFKLLTKIKAHSTTYDFSGEIVNKFSKEQMNKSVYAPRVNAHIVRSIVKNSHRSPTISSLLQAGSLVKF